jgi:hypothetical protein
LAMVLNSLMLRARCSRRTPQKTRLR